MLRDDAVRFADKAAAAAVPVVLEVFEGMPHGFAILPLDASQVLLSRIAAFAASRLAGISGAPAGP
jgi:acetyl esterase/lipase